MPTHEIETLCTYKDFIKLYNGLESNKVISLAIFMLDVSRSPKKSKLVVPPDNHIKFSVSI